MVATLVALQCNGGPVAKNDKSSHNRDRIHCLFARYHSIVALRPTSKDVSAENPKNSFARDTSSFRRGCPLGLVVSQNISPGNPTRRVIVSVRSLMLISCELPRFTGSLPSYRSAARTIPSAASSTYRNSRVGLPSPQTVTIADCGLEIAWRRGTS